ncbi:MAG: RNA polymerase sigma factor [Clostridia bacterium]|nr:RNA polymerase sigma factor [Clostridia bacterium]
MTDYDIVRECLKGNKEAFSEIVSRYKNLVFSKVYASVGNYEDTLDLSQEIFVKIYKNLEKYDPDYSFATWVIRITLNHTIDYMRKNKIQTVPADENEYNIKYGGLSPEQEYLNKEDREKLNRAIDELSDKYRIPLVMYYSQGMKYQEISRVLNIPLSKVKNRIYRARKMLKINIEKGED